MDPSSRPSAGEAVMPAAAVNAKSGSSWPLGGSITRLTAKT